MKLKRYSPDLCVQMATCDANYIRILKLLPEFGVGVTREIEIPCYQSEGLAEKVGENLIFELSVTEVFRYTSTLSIRQNFPKEQWPVYRRPEMQVRIYHDANTAEVVSYQNHRYFRASYLLPNNPMYQPDEKQQLNLFLGEWLALCLGKGISRRDFPLDFTSLSSA